MLDMATPRAPRTRGPILLATLSFLFPGLGQAVARRRRAAVVLAVPAAILVLLVLLVVLVRGIESAALSMLAPSTALSVAVLALLAGAWRILAVLHAAWLAWPRAARAVPGRPGRASTAALGGFAVTAPRWTGVRKILLTLLVVAIALPHAIAGWYAWSLYEAGTRIFSGGWSGGLPGGPPGTSLPTLEPGATPWPTPTAPPGPERFTVVLIGIDSSPTRTHALTDTLIVVSVEPETGEAAMVSFPRDIALFPLADGRVYRDRINSLMSYADRHPTDLPGGGLNVVAAELGYLLGIPVPYYAAVDLEGFVDMIDAVGGVTIDNPKAINDPGYGGWTDGRVGFRLSAGVHELDGQTALAYARSRKGSGDNDFTRARRQQQLIVALGRRLSDPTMFGQLPRVLDAASRAIRTNVPVDKLPTLLDLGRRLEDRQIRRVVLGPPYAVRSADPSRYVLEFVPEKLADISVRFFGEDSRYAAATGAG